jgi:alpha-glucosidase
MGETFAPDLPALAAYFGTGDELQLVQNFFFASTPFEPAALREDAESWMDACPPGATPVWNASNHDMSRFPTRWCRGDERRVRLALTMLLTLPGACLLYQGDEIGMEDVPVPPGRRQDTLGDRDPARTPLPWTAEPGAGFTTGVPWLPIGDPPRDSVGAQREDPGSVLNLARDLIALRPRLGPYRPLSAGPGRWRYRRGDVEVELDFEGPAARVSG